ncbi:Rpn family recombination-promoting nuclease/putative transposase [Nostoc sp. DSM 114160]
MRLIETILIYKLPRLSQEEIGKMFGANFELNDLRQTRFFQDVFEEGKKEGKQEAFEEAKQEGKQEAFEEGKQEAKLEVIPHLLAFGCSIEQIAQALGLDEQVVRQAAQPKS